MEKRAFKSKLFLRTGDGPVLEGYGFTFGEVTEDGAYGKESFAPDCRIDFPKRCFLLRDHDRGKILGRRGKNLTIEKDREGLRFEVSRLPDTELARETRALIKDGLIQDVSIGFYAKDSDLKDDVRTYKHIELHELSILPSGYFESGKVAARAKEAAVYPPELI